MLFILFSHMLGFYFFREEAMCELANLFDCLLSSIDVLTPHPPFFFPQVSRYLVLFL